MRKPVFSTAGLALGIAVSCLVASGQRSTAPPASPPSTPPGGGTTPGGGRTPTAPGFPQPGDNRQQNPQNQEMRTVIFLSGKVMLDDGTPPPDSVVIQRVCGVAMRPEAYTDSKGRFSFEVGRSMDVMADASVGSLNSIDDPTNQRRATAGSNSLGGVESTRMMGCELRAYLPGYRSDVIDLTGRRSMESPDVGVIVLHRLANVQGTTISATSLLAPKDAKKAYEKGFAATQKKKWKEAQTQLEKAVAMYPQYAAAWFELGLAYAGQNNLESARTAYGRALATDAKFLKPYMELSTISMKEKKWDEVVTTTDRLIRLDPVDFPAAYYYNSVGNLSLHSLDAAEKSAREGMKLDPNHQFPALEHLLGVILANKMDYPGAAQFMRSYLQHAPDSSDADGVRKQLAEIDKLLGRAAAQAKPAQ